MGFKKAVTIYESETVRVFINQCHTRGRKTRVFVIRRDDRTGYGHLLGKISWNGAWRQYTFSPDEITTWSSGCLKGIINFLEKINKEERAKWKKKR